MLSSAIVAIVLGIAYIVRPTWKRNMVERRIEKGDDRFFEEQRSYRSYPGWKKVQNRRVLGIFLLCAGITLLTVDFLGIL
jgi:hypothetical protein